MSKKILAIVLALVMCLTMLPVTALAGAGVEPHTHEDAEGHEVVFQPWATATELPTDGGSYYLDTDVELTDTWVVSSATPTNLCLNGHVISVGGRSIRVIQVYGDGVLNLYDCETRAEDDRTHKGYVDAEGLWHSGIGVGRAEPIIGGLITGDKIGNDFMAAGGVEVLVGGSFTMNGGNICGNLGTAGNIYVDFNGSFTMNGGNIVYNYGGGGAGGGVWLEKGLFKMTGGSIRENVSTSGGGVYVAAEGIFKMTGGSISGNTVPYSENGGGVDVWGEMIMEGGSITGNSVGSDGFGGGIAFERGTLKIGGTAKVQGNKNARGANENVYIIKNNFLTIGTGSIPSGNGVAVPADGFSVGVTVAEFDEERGICVTTTGSFITNAKEDDANYFSSDSSAYKVAYNRDGKYLELVDDSGSTLLRLLRAALVTKLTVCHLVRGVTTSAARIAKIAAFNAALPALIARWFRHF